MIQDLNSYGLKRSVTRTALATAVAALVVVAPLQASAANNSGRYVVTSEDGSWRAVDQGGGDSVFYPSWYAGLNVSQSEWDAKQFKSKSSGAGLVLGNHFSPHLRWELRHRYQQPEHKFTGIEGETRTLTSIALDYIIAEPADGFSALLRGGVATADGDGLSSEQTDAVALLGLGMQWREDRWLVRMMLEQAGEDQSWGGMTVAGYLGGKVETSAASYEGAESPAEENSVTEPLEAPSGVGSVPSAATADCGHVFSTRVINDIKFDGANSAELTAKSEQQLAQIGASYARRSYVVVDVRIMAANQALADARTAAVVAALSAGGDLGGRVNGLASVGADVLSLSMKDTRRCN